MMRHIDIVALALSVGLLIIVFELVRRRSLREQYSLLWLLTAVVMVGLSLWRGALEALARLLGIFYAPSALMLVGMIFVLLILLHFSLVVSKLSEENKELAQRYAIMDRKAREIESKLNVYYRLN